MKMIRTLFAPAIVALSLGAGGAAYAADYAIDVAGAHASINFKVNHLGVSWTTGRFDTFDGSFSFDSANPADGKVEVTIDTASVNSNHAERDNHLRSGDFLDVANFPEATFVSTGITLTGDMTAKITGDLTLLGTTKEIVIDATFMGEGDDPWGGYRAGFTGTTAFAMKDFGVKMDLGPASQMVELELHVEGIRQ